ncbi:MAG: hypothetical protein ACTSRS_19235, partial [Candidatus Helarchaeota archaeon]
WICKYWYLGQYYGTFLCTRVIASVKPEAPSLANAYTFLLNSQLADGGWGRNATSNPLDTALALISLHYLKLVGYQVGESMKQGVEYLCAEQFQNGSYQAVPLWTSYPDTYYQGQTLTTAFVVKALSLYLSTIQPTIDLCILENLIIITALLLLFIFVINRNTSPRRKK